ncbi:MAG: hypothetical protein AAFY11_16225, partial [Cyanobacteria bacterium J06641_5]
RHSTLGDVCTPGASLTTPGSVEPHAPKAAAAAVLAAVVVKKYLRFTIAPPKALKTCLQNRPLS